VLENQKSKNILAKNMNLRIFDDKATFSGKID